MLLESIYKNINNPVSLWVEKRWNMCEKKHQDSWSVPNSFLETLLRYKDSILGLVDIEIFVETGTHLGFTSDIMAKHFSHVYTVEKYIDEEKTQAHNNLKEYNNNITFYYEDTRTGLLKINEIVKDQRCVILLDAHNGDDSPVLSELTIIKQCYNKNSVIIVDDCCDLGRGSWPTQEVFEKNLLDINSNYKIVYTGTEIGRYICLIYPSNL